MDDSNLSVGRVNQQIDSWAHKHSDYTLLLFSLFFIGYFY